jgi:cell division protein FtsQ
MVQVRREAGRRRLRAIGIGVGVVVLVAALAVVTRLPILTVGRVEVTGATYTDRATLNKVVAAIKGSPMLSVDLGKARRTLAASPWVERVSIRKDWPRTVRIDLAERTPAAAYLAQDGRVRVIDDEGYVIASLTGQPVAYPDIVPVGRATGGGLAVAPGGRVPEALADAARLARMLPDELRVKVKQIGLDQDGNLELLLNPHGTILLGPITDMSNKLLAVLAVSHQLDLTTVDTLDVRTPPRLACAPAKACKSLTAGTS